MRSAAVLCLEQHLVRVGHLATADDYFDVTTAAAVAAYQERVGLRVTGVAGPATLARLGIWSGPSFTTPCTAASPVRPGTTSARARCVEQRLVALGFILTGPDRRFDATAVTAVRAYQRQVGLVVTGIAGPATLARLGIWSGPSITVACQVSRPVIHGTAGLVARCVEQRLVQLGYDLRGPDRTFDGSAVAALRAFQSSRGLLADGMAGKVVLRALKIWKEPLRVTCRVSVTVRLGTTGSPALCTERKMVKLGFALEGPDRTFDASAVNALRAFQRAHGLSVDGVAGPVTLSRLGIWKPPDPTLLPRNSGSGRRIVYLRSAQRIWAVDSNGAVLKTHLVSGRLYEPYAGTYEVYSRSLYSFATQNPSIRWRYMVRFAYGPQGGRIGFHEIPNRNGVPLQSVSQLGQPLSGGCVRQATADAQWIWNWAGLGTKVVVL
jgi:peptidoglycan hydrolase-like protein with peptidoglycan-binding domain